MATPQTVISHNHYEFQITSTDGSATVIISVEQNDGVLLSGLTEDQFADLIRDHVAGQSGYVSGALFKKGVASTAL